LSRKSEQDQEQNQGAMRTGTQPTGTVRGEHSEGALLKVAQPKTVKRSTTTLGNSVNRIGKKGWTLLYGGNIKIGKNEVRVHTYVELSVVVGGGGTENPPAGNQSDHITNWSWGGIFIHQPFFSGQTPHWLSPEK
jgi:hypothetical protein